MKPLQQGFDGLCGAYASVNAVRLLLPRPRLTTDQEELLLRAFMMELAERAEHTKRELVDYIFGPQKGTVLKELKLGLEGVLSSVGEPPFLSSIKYRELPRETLSLDDFWNLLTEHIASGESGTRTAIVGMRRPHDHWTVVQKIGSRSISLFDSSGGLRVVRRDQCTRVSPTSEGRRERRNAFRPKETLLLSRLP